MKKLLANRPLGFSLAELLVAIVVILMVLTILSAVFTLNQRVFRGTNTRAELVQNGRIVTDLMTREIRQAQAMVTVLGTDSASAMHELEFEDGHTTNQIQYIKYVLDGTDLERHTIVYYFTSDPSIYVHFDDTDAFGLPQSATQEEKVIGQYFSQLDFYGLDDITIDYTLEKNTIDVAMQTIIHPRN